MLRQVNAIMASVLIGISLISISNAEDASPENIQNQESTPVLVAVDGRFSQQSIKRFTEKLRLTYVEPNEADKKSAFILTTIRGVTTALVWYPLSDVSIETATAVTAWLTSWTTTRSQVSAKRGATPFLKLIETYRDHECEDCRMSNPLWRNF